MGETDRAGCNPGLRPEIPGMYGSREMPFNMSDQDALNIAIMYTKSPLTTLGPQGMGFIFGASMMMYHAVGQKPWRGSFLLRALRGMPPSGAMKFFLHAGRIADSRLFPFAVARQAHGVFHRGTSSAAFTAAGKQVAEMPGHHEFTAGSYDACNFLLPVPGGIAGWRASRSRRSPAQHLSCPGGIRVQHRRVAGSRIGIE
jgi:hypothetical protein